MSRPHSSANAAEVRAIALGQIGQRPFDIDVKKLSSWRSEVFNLNEKIFSVQLSENAESETGEYTNEQLDRYTKIHEGQGDVLLILTNIRLQDGAFMARLTGNRIVVSLLALRTILQANNIPLENFILRVIYGVTLLYRRFGKRIPPYYERILYTHDETRGCLFDTNVGYSDVIYSCHEPIICDSCVNVLKEAQVPREIITIAQREISKIRKLLFHRLAEHAQRHPWWALFASLIISLLTGMFGSLLMGD